MVELINYKYLGFTVVILILIYILIVHKQRILHEKISPDQYNKNMVKVFINGKISRMNPNLLVMNLNKVKNSINQFEKTPIQTDLNQIALCDCLKNAKTDMSSYISINANKHTANKYEEIENEKLIKQIVSKNTIDLVGYNVDNIGLKNYIDEVINIIQSSIYRNGVLNFDSLTVMLNVLNKINNEKNVNLIYMKKTGSVDDKEVDRRTRITNSEDDLTSSETFSALQKNRQIRHVDGSQSQFDKTVTTGNHQKIKMYNVSNGFDITDHTIFKTKNSHNSSIKFNNNTIPTGAINKSRGSHVYSLQFIGDKLIDNYNRSRLN
jgi:hypothetical protein